MYEAARVGRINGVEPREMKVARFDRIYMYPWSICSNKTCKRRASGACNIFKSLIVYRIK